MGLSRNKVAVPEGAAGTPPFWRGLESRLNPERERQRSGLEGTQDTMSSHRPMAASLLRSLSFPIHWEILRCWGPLLFSGGLAQLARAPALQAGGQRFESVILHTVPHSSEASEQRTVNNGLRMTRFFTFHSSLFTCAKGAPRSLTY